MKQAWFTGGMRISVIALAVILLGGAITVKISETTGILSPLSAKAADPLYHWPHTSLPMTLKMVNYSTTRLWPTYIDLAIADWKKSGVVNIAQKEGMIDECQLVYGQINFCTFDQPNSGLISWSQRGSQADGHIMFGQINFNNAYLATDPVYGVPAWRNYMMCYSIGFTLGLEHRVAPSTGGISCMESTNFVDVNQQQHPSNADLTALKVAYDHSDSIKTTTAPRPSPTTVSTIDAPKSWGNLVGTSANGSIQYYRATLDNGTTVYTAAFVDQRYVK